MFDTHNFAKRRLFFYSTTMTELAGLADTISNPESCLREFSRLVIGDGKGPVQARCPTLPANNASPFVAFTAVRE